MSGVNILIGIVALIGFLPLAVFIYGKRRANRILTTGTTARAIVYDTRTASKGNYEIVHYYFIASDGREYKGRLTTRPGLHRVNGTIEVFYLPDNPNENTVKGTWNDNWFLLFVLLIAIAVLYMMYELYLMVNV
jgi:hypothetical protein